MTCWADVIGVEKEQSYFKQTLAFVRQEREAGKLIYPPAADVFNAFKYTEFDQVRVVILGQDPYHGPRQAHGLCFSVQPGVATPPSLVNIYKELARDIPGFQIPSHGYLVSWAAQGVLLLNTVLTVEAGMAHSHAKLGWEQFTDAVIDVVNKQTSNTVFILWGSKAKLKGKFIDTEKHLILSAVHPSPLAANRGGFFGSKPFSKANEYLVQHGKQAIDWQLPQ